MREVRKVFTMKLSDAERERLKRIARLTGDSEGAILRNFVRNARIAPDKITAELTVGFPGDGQ